MRMHRFDMIVWVADDALEFMVAGAKQHNPLETGGVLAGYWANPEEIVVLNASGPGLNARHFAERFHPDADFQEHWIAACYEQSGGVATYLGDWHTHPDSIEVNLSRKDRSAARAIAKHEEARAPQPLTVILLGSEGRWRPVAWVARCTRPLWLLGTRTDFIECSVRIFVPVTD